MTFYHPPDFVLVIVISLAAIAHYFMRVLHVPYISCVICTPPMKIRKKKRKNFRLAFYKYVAERAKDLKEKK